MKNSLAVGLILSGLLITSVTANSLTHMTLGTPNIQTINALAFGPDGILFIGDAKSAAIYAVETGDTDSGNKVENISLAGVDETIAQLLGATSKDFTIVDMAVNPISKNLYFAIQHTNGESILLKYSTDGFSSVSLENVKFSSVSMDGPVAEDAKDRRGRSLRRWAVSDLSYYNGKVMVSGLSNEEFGSTFRSIPFPFVDNQAQSSLEIYHAAHGRYETGSPIKTFTAAMIDDAEFLIASYTCTPLVLFPMKDLKKGEHVKGRTIAELGSNNSPLDMITMKKNGAKYLLIANSSRAVMKVKFSDIKEFKDSLTTPVSESSATAGVEFVALPFVNVLQMDVFDESRFVMLQRKSNGSLDLVTQGNRWL